MDCAPIRAGSILDTNVFLAPIRSSPPARWSDTTYRPSESRTRALVRRPERTRSVSGIDCSFTAQGRNLTPEYSRFQPAHSDRLLSQPTRTSTTFTAPGLTASGSIPRRSSSPVPRPIPRPPREAPLTTPRSSRRPAKTPAPRSPRPRVRQTANDRSPRDYSCSFEHHR